MRGASRAMEKTPASAGIVVNPRPLLIASDSRFSKGGLFSAKRRIRRPEPSREVFLPAILGREKPEGILGDGGVKNEKGKNNSH